MFPLMDPTAWSARPTSPPTATSTRPSSATPWRTWPAQTGVQVHPHTRVTGIDAERRPGRPGAHRPRQHRLRGRRRLRRDVRRRDRPDGRRAGPAGADVAPVRRHRRVPASRRRPARCRPCATPTCSSTTGRRCDGLVMGGYERDRRAVDRRPPDLRRHPGRLQRPAAARGLGPVRGDHRQRPASGCPAMADVGLRKMINGPEAFTPDNEFCLGETEVDGFFVAAGFCAHGIAGAGGIGKVMAEWIVDGDPGMDLWHMDVRRFGRQYRSPSYTLAADAGELRDLLRHRLPRARARGGPAAAHLARRTPGTPSTARRSARSPAGSGSTTTRATPPPATSRCGRAAGPAGCWSPADRRRARGDPRGGRRCSTSRRSPR